MALEPFALTLPVLLPLGAALVATAWPSSARVVGLSTAGATLIAVVWLLLRVLEAGSISVALGGWAPPLGIPLAADGLSAMMLLMTAVVGLGIALVAPGYYQSVQEQHFWPLWLLLLASLNGLFLAADLFNLYVTLELLGLAAVALAVLEGKRAAIEAGLRYLVVGLLGSLAYLLGVALLYADLGRLDLAGLAELVTPAPAATLALALMTLGLLLKGALFPLHFWLPPAHSSASAPVSAALSALVVKAAFFLVLRLWLDLYPALVTPVAAGLIGLLGAAAVLWGSWYALQAERLKLLAAYSTVAQIGYLFLFLALIAVTPSPAREPLVAAALLFAIGHALAKSSLFLAIGMIQQQVGHDRIAELEGAAQRLPLMIFVIALAGVALIGLPPSAAFLGKWGLLSSAIQGGHWAIVGVVALGTLLAGAYTFRVLIHAFSTLPAAERAAVGVVPQLAVLLLALGATLILGLGSAPLYELLAPAAMGLGSAS